MTAGGSLLESELRALGGLRLWRDAPLAPFTTMGVGGKTPLLVTAATPQALSGAVAVLGRTGVPWTVLGSGSNVLVADRGFPGVVLKLDSALSYVQRLAGNRVEAGGALALPRLAALVAEWGLSGLEFAAGIPGSVGGAVAMNAGAHHASFGDVVEVVELAHEHGVEWRPAADFVWEYRHCSLPPGAVVTAVRLALVGEERELVLERQRALMRARRRTQPRGVRTFGSAFKNPPGDAAGRLLERAGMKGVRRGGAQVSPLHANFIVNLGDASCSDVLVLMGMMRQAVQQQFGLALDPEVRLLGEVFPWLRGEISARGVAPSATNPADSPLAPVIDERAPGA